MARALRPIRFVLMARRSHPGVVVLLLLAGYTAACSSAMPTEPSRSDSSVTPAAAAASSSDSAPPPPGIDVSALSVEDELLARINQHRGNGTTCGATPMPAVPLLTTDERLRHAARVHSQDMAAGDYFSHTSPDGRSSTDRIRAAGYDGGPYGENIAGGYSSPAAVVSGWMSSPSHCRVVMNAGFKAAGAGYAYRSGSRYGHYWTLTIGSR